MQHTEAHDSLRGHYFVLHVRETDCINVNQSYTLMHHPDQILSKTFWEIGVLQRIAISM